MYSIGIDSGSTATKAVLFDGQNIVDKLIKPTSWSPKTTSKEIYEELLKRNNLDRSKIKKVIGTGYGRVSMDFIDKSVTEITCHCKGAYYYDNSIRTILDIGGQDSKVISLDDNGNVKEFLMNDKCAAGTGKFLNIMCNTLGIDIYELDNLDFCDVKPSSISNMCAVFAESEVISLLAKGESKDSILKGIIVSICNRGSSLLGKINQTPKIAFTGGLSQSKLIKETLQQIIKKDIIIPKDSQFIGAIGASIIAYK